VSALENVWHLFLGVGGALKAGLAGRKKGALIWVTPRVQQLLARVAAWLCDS
jgi:hypothetical protein